MSNKILLTCGIGDFVAIESHLTVKETYDVETIYWATRAKNYIMPLIPYVFPNVKNHITVRDNWDNNFCVETIEDLSGSDINLDEVEDYSVSVFCRQILLNQRSYQGSSLIKRKLCDISHFKLPSKYFVIHPYSENARTEARDLNETEWIHVKNTVGKHLPLVILNKSALETEICDGMIDLSNQTNILESIEIAKMSAGFYGASSIISVVCSKVLPYWKMHVKGHSLLKQDFWEFYYAPLPNNNFISESLIKPIPKYALI